MVLSARVFNLRLAESSSILILYIFTDNLAELIALELLALSLSWRFDLFTQTIGSSSISRLATKCLNARP